MAVQLVQSHSDVTVVFYMLSILLFRHMQHLDLLQEQKVTYAKSTRHGGVGIDQGLIAKFFQDSNQLLDSDIKKTSISSYCSLKNWFRNLKALVKYKNSF